MNTGFEASNHFYVYTHTRNDTGAVFYVGKGKLRRAWNKSLRSAYWKKIVEKCGYTVNIVRQGISEVCAFSLEKALIHAARSNGCVLVNFTNGGEGKSGCIASEETRLKQRMAKVGRPLSSEHRERISFAHKAKKYTAESKRHFLGKSHSEAAKEKIRLAATGRGHTDETKEKIKAIKTGIKASEQTRQKMSASLSGAKNPHHCPMMHNFYHPDFGYRSCTQLELRKEFSLPHGNLSKVVSGTRSNVKGWRLVSRLRED